MNFAAIRAGVKATISIVGFEVQDLRPIPIAPGCIVVPKPPLDLDFTFEGANTRFEMAITVLVPFADVGNGQTRLDGYLNTSDATSFISQLRANPTLSGVVKSFNVHTLENYDVMSFDNGVTEFLGATLIGEVLT